MEFHIPVKPAHGAVDSLVGARDQDIVLRSRTQHHAHDAGHLLGGLPVCVDDLGKTLAQYAVMIDLGKAEIFERQVSQPLGSLGDRQVALLHIIEESANVPVVHRSRL